MKHLFQNASNYYLQAQKVTLAGSRLFSQLFRGKNAHSKTICLEDYKYRASIQYDISTINNENGTTFCMQLFNARNSFKHISRSTCGTFAATQPPYSFAYMEEIY